MEHSVEMQSIAHCTTLDIGMMQSVIENVTIEDLHHHPLH